MQQVSETTTVTRLHTHMYTSTHPQFAHTIIYHTSASAHAYALLVRNHTCICSAEHNSLTPSSHRTYDSYSWGPPGSELKRFLRDVKVLLAVALGDEDITDWGNIHHCGPRRITDVPQDDDTNYGPVMPQQVSDRCGYLPPAAPHFLAIAHLHVYCPYQMNGCDCGVFSIILGCAAIHANVDTVLSHLCQVSCSAGRHRLVKGGGGTCLGQRNTRTRTTLTFLATCSTGMDSSCSPANLT